MEDGRKPYQCRECKHESEHDTNHYASIVPFCKVCKKHTYHDYTGEIPEGGWVPETFPQSHVDMLNEKFPNGI
jgi:hypothetical protein